MKKHKFIDINISFEDYKKGDTLIDLIAKTLIKEKKLGLPSMYDDGDQTTLEDYV